MKYFTLSVILIFMGFELSFAQTADDGAGNYATQSQLEELGNKVDSLQNSLNELNEAQSRTEVRLNSLSHEFSSAIQSLNDDNTAVKISVDSLKGECGELRDMQRSDTENLHQKIAETGDSVKSDLNARTVWFIVIAVLIVIILILVAVVLSMRLKKETSSIAEVRKAQDTLQSAQAKLQEESVQLDNKLIELLDRQMTTSGGNQSGAETDHSLALKVADEVARIETNLLHMDPSVKGYKQLQRAVRHIKDNFVANGYEIVDMLGKQYNGGMKAIANFVTDENLKDGQQIITKVIKPQVNYNQRMIQSAEIEVSQPE
ncbi:MAG: hypothetical protein LUC91_02610 [Prevotella sp.]|nr:hypothetical protein [Prevotella sp.]